MRLRTALIAIAMIVAAPAAHAAECMQDNQPDQIAEGMLTVGQFEDAAGRPEQAFILVLPAPAPTCLGGGDADSAVGSTTTIHIYSFDSAVSDVLKSLVGQSVQVRGTPFGAHTAHHHAPIVMDVSEIDAI
jgi:hypothetical protein